MIQTAQGEYRKNGLQLREAAIPTTDLFSTSTSSTTTSITVQLTSFPLYEGCAYQAPMHYQEIT